MNDDILRGYKEKYRRELEECLEFWLTHSIDRKNGGVYNFLDRQGNVYATDKSVWIQGRCAWMFSYSSMLYGEKELWRTTAKHCLDFLDNHCIDPADGRMYFIVTEDGRPVRKRRYYFSETFYIMACAEYGAAFNDPAYTQKARKYFDLALQLYDGKDPYYVTPKFIEANRKLRAFAPPMILLNIAHVMLRCDSQYAEKYRAAAARFSDDIIRYFYKEDLKALLETVGPDGEFLRDIMGGRTVNPGHAVEGAWFLLMQAQDTGDKALLEKVQNIFDWSMEIGWDKEYGGLYSFVDVLGHPHDALEHDMKLWWPMSEAMLCAILLYEETGDEKYFRWFETMDAYFFEKFKDAKEWLGYLRRDGTPTLPACKGNLFKGPFHIPRMFAMAEQCLSRLEAAKKGL